MKLIGCALFCLMICVMAFLNRTLVLEPVTAFVRGGIGFEEMKTTLRQNLLGERLRGRDELLSLNGGYARATGRTRYNGVQRMTDGMLTDTSDSLPDTTVFAENLSRFHQLLKGEGIPFLFVLAPCKEPMEESLLPAGVTDMANALGDRAVSELRERNVPVLDLREEMSRTREQVERYFYRTDHHWNGEGAFFAYQRIMEAIRAVFPETQMTYTDPSLWEKNVIPNWWLGSHGRRVGPLFAGMDDLDYDLPLFETKMSRYSLGVWTCKGDFRRANIREWLLETSDCMRIDNYFRYLGGGYPLTYHRNAGAENRMKLLLIGDSFKHPVEAFLSTELTYLDVLDPREYGKMSEWDYVRLNPPDMVIMLNYPGTLANGYFSGFGEGAGLETVGETFWEGAVASALEGETDYVELPAELESGKSYRLTLEGIEIRAGDPDGAGVVLCDGENIVDQTVFDIDYGNAFEFRWGFQIPERPEGGGDYRLRLYGGVSGGTEGVELAYQGIRLTECLLPKE